jgi:hypothetical protein
MLRVTLDLFLFVPHKIWTETWIKSLHEQNLQIRIGRDFSIQLSPHGRFSKQVKDQIQKYRKTSQMKGKPSTQL